MLNRRLIVLVLLGALALCPMPALAQAGRVLRVATDTNLPWLDPHMGTAFTLRELSSHVFEGLVTIMRGVTGNQPAFYRIQPSFFFPEQKVWHNLTGQEVYNARNLDLARRLLRESGYDGRPIVLITNRDIEWLYRAAVPAKPQLEAIGFKVELVVRDWPGQIAQQKELNFDMATNGVSTRPEPTGFNYLFQCGASYETYGYCDPEMDKALTAGLREREPDKRAHAYGQAQKQFYETVPFVKIGDMFQLDGASKTLQGYRVYFLRRFWNVSK